MDVRNTIRELVSNSWNNSFGEEAVNRVLQEFVQESTGDSINYAEELERLGYIVKLRPPDQDSIYGLTDLGTRLVNASATKPLSRKTADRLVKEFLSRCRALERLKDLYAYTVDELYVFGSYITEAPTLSDIDFGLSLRPRFEDREQQIAFEDKLIKDAGGIHAIGGIFATVGYCSKKVKQFLRSKNSYFSLHSIEGDVLESKPDLPRKLLYSSRFGDMTIPLPKDLQSKSASAIIFRCGYGDRIDGLDMRGSLTEYVRGYEAAPPPPKTREVRRSTAQVIRVVAIGGSPAVEIGEIIKTESSIDLGCGCGQLTSWLIKTNIPKKHIPDFIGDGTLVGCEILENDDSTPTYSLLIMKGQLDCYSIKAEMVKSHFLEGPKIDFNSQKEAEKCLKAIGSCWARAGSKTEEYSFSRPNIFFISVHLKEFALHQGLDILDGREMMAWPRRRLGESSRLDERFEVTTMLVAPTPARCSIVEH